MTVKESSTPVKDTFLGFYSQESFSSNSPENLLDENGQKIYEINSVEDFLLEFNNENNEVIQHSIPDYDSSESISNEPKNDVIVNDINNFTKRTNRGKPVSRSAGQMS